MSTRLWKSSLVATIAFFCGTGFASAAAGDYFCACYYTPTGSSANACETTIAPTILGCDSKCRTNVGGKGTFLKSAAAPDGTPESLQIDAKCAAVAAPTETPPREIVAPNLEIKIPGVVFTPALQGQGKLTVNWIGEYIQGVYKYLLGISVVVAIIMVMIGGLQYVMAAGGGDTKVAKTRIKNAAVGLVLLFSVYLLLYSVGGSQLTDLNAVNLTMVPRIDTSPYENEDETVSGTYGGHTLTDATDAYVSGPGANQIPQALIAPLRQAAATAVGSGKTSRLYVASGIRTVDKQLDIMRDHCQSPAGSSAPCNRKPGQSTACMLRPCSAGSGVFCVPDANGKYWNAASCPHTTGHALDVWGMDGGGQQCIKLANCLGTNVTTCRNNPCQAAVIAAMRSQGFCNLQSEPWHFEKPKMSSACN